MQHALQLDLHVFHKKDLARNHRHYRVTVTQTLPVWPYLAALAAVLHHTRLEVLLATLNALPSVPPDGRG